MRIGYFPVLQIVSYVHHDTRSQNWVCNRFVAIMLICYKILHGLFVLLYFIKIRLCGHKLITKYCFWGVCRFEKLYNLNDVF